MPMTPEQIQIQIENTRIYPCHCPLRGRERAHVELRCALHTFWQRVDAGQRERLLCLHTPV